MKVPFLAKLLYPTIRGTIVQWVTQRGFKIPDTDVSKIATEAKISTDSVHRVETKMQTLLIQQLDQLFGYGS